MTTPRISIGGKLCLAALMLAVAAMMPTPAQAQEMHAFLRDKVADVDSGAAQRLRIVYGGSVNPDNAGELFAKEDIDGGLVGGAGLDPVKFSAVVAAAAE